MQFPLNLSAEPEVTVLLNGERIGLLQEFTVSRSVVCTPLWGFGDALPGAVYSGKRSYSVVLKRLLLDRQELPAKLSAFDLKDFTLELRLPTRRLSFSGCQTSLIKESYTLGQNVVEELRVSAASCKRTAVA